MKEEKATREGFGVGIVELGRSNPAVYVIDCDISSSMKTADFRNEFPKRYVNVGVAEQNGAGFAAGLATTGKIPFVCTYATFGSMRMCEQIRTSICYPKLNVKFACSHGGLTPGNDGATHQGIEDIGIMTSIPNMTVIMPGDFNATRKLVMAAADYEGPVYLRFTRDPIPQIYGENESFEIGKGKILREGTDITFFAIGDMLAYSLRAAEALSQEGISAEVVDMFTIKPLDTALVLRALARHGKIVTVEDHNVFNGLGAAVAAVVSECGHGVMRRVAIPDAFGESGRFEQLAQKYQIDVPTIIRRAKEIL